MAGIARNRGVGAQQRETIEVIAHVGHRNTPAADRVAILAGRTHLASVDVGVTIGAHFPDFGKDRVGMTLAALHALMHSAQRELRVRVVIELWLGADRFPAQRGMAAFARQLQGAVWILAARCFAALRAHQCGARKEQHAQR